MEFKINLATRIYIDKKQLRLYLALAVILLVAMLFLSISNIVLKGSQIKDYSSRIAALNQKSKAVSKGVSEKEYNALLPRIYFANSVIDKKRYNWLALLDRLELVVPDGVAISAVQPDTKTNELKLPGVARNFDRLRVFMEKLEESKLFTDVYLTNQTEATLEDKTKGITFTLTCKVIYK